MKIYTRTGDKGESGLLGGTRVPKDHVRLEAYGTVDELNANVGMLRDLAVPHHAELLVNIQSMLFTIGSHLSSTSPEDAAKFKVPSVTDADIIALEQAMDAMDKDLPPMRSFILPGGHLSVSQAHICRTICRRAERRVVQLGREVTVDPVLVRYLNRLSDLFFVMARHLAHLNGTSDLPWKPNAGTARPA